MESRHIDMCRVCRSEGSPEKPLFHPCVCAGSIKYIHQDCLVQWLKYSKKEYCELCKHRYIFTPIYAPDMPKRLPIRDLVFGLLRGILRAVRYWLHYTLVALAWLGIVPLTACRIYRCLFSGSFSSLLTLPLDLLSTENIVSDCFQGCFIVTCTLCTFISLVWLREQILHGGGPDWLDQEPALANHRQHDAGADNNARVAGDAGQPEPNAADAADDDGAAEDRDDDDADDEHNDDDNDNNDGGQDDVNWNPMDWDRAAEELTWERLLGLDGSLLFMEHVFWVVSLNTLFILVFAFCPFHIGNFALTGLQAQELMTSTQFEGLLTTLLGYIIIAFSLACLHYLMSVLRLRKLRRVLGLCYVAVKVSLLVVMEIGFFPLICGWWLDICSLNMFEATLKDREHSFRIAPGTSMFIHWLVGMVYIFYFASFILLLREVLRPGVLWFLRNLNDPDFNPIQEMIHLPIYRHARRFLASMVVFGSIVLVMLWLPVQVVRHIFPNFLPFHVMLSSDTPVSELSLELLLLQVVLPALLEQGHTRQWLKALIRGWCVVAAWLLNLRSYLLGDVPLDEPGHNETAESPAAEAESHDVVAETDVVDGTAEAGCEASAVENCDDTEAASVSLASDGEREHADCQLMSSDRTAATSESDASESASTITGCVRQNDGHCIQLVDGVGQLTDDVVEHRHQYESSAVAAESELLVAAAASADAELPDGGLVGADVGDTVCVQVPVDEIANDLAARDEAPAPAVLNEPQQQAVDAADADAEVVEPVGNIIPPPLAVLAPQGLGDVHQAMMQGGGPVGFQPYKHPNLFALRLLCLLVLVCSTLFLASLASLLVPVYIGRRLMGIWTGELKVHELYTVACGLYACWVVLRTAMILYTWIPQGWRAIFNKIVEWTVLVSKSLFIAVILIGIIPLMLGLIFELVIVMPIRVPLEMTPIFFPWQDWALGVLHAKIITAATMMGPQWRLKRVIEQVYQQGLRNMNLRLIIVELCLPVVVCLGLILAVPHIIAKSIVPALGCDFELQNLILRRIYPFILGVVLFVAFCIFQARQFRRLYEHIKNDKYLVGQRLVNYERR